MSARQDEDRTPLSERMGPERLAPAPSRQTSLGGAWPVALAGVLLAAVAVGAGVAAGAQYAIPVAVLGALGLIFYATHRTLGLRATRRGPAGEMRSEDDGDEPVPHLGFDERTELGDTEQQPDVQHAEPRSTGAR
jgi:hypothetical protein